TADLMQQALGGSHGLWAIKQKVAEPPIYFFIELVAQAAFGEQPQLAGAFTTKTFGGEGVTTGGAFANRLDDERADHGWCQANAYLGQRQLGISRPDGYIAAGNKTNRAAKSRTLNNGQRRYFQVVELVHQLAKLMSVAHVGVVIEASGTLHPRQISTRREMLAAAAHQQEAQRFIALHFIERLDQFADHLGVEGVVLFR